MVCAADFCCNLLIWSEKAFAYITQTCECEAAAFLWMQDMIS